MDRRSRTSKVVNLIHLGKKGVNDIMTQEFKIRMTQEMTDVISAPGKKVVDADHVVTLVDQAVAEMRADKARTAGNQNPQGKPSVKNPQRTQRLIKRRAKESLLIRRDGTLHLPRTTLFPILPLQKPLENKGFHLSHISSFNDQTIIQIT